VEFHVRSARVTDVEPAVRLMAEAGANGTGHDEADLLRSMLYLPSATVVVAEMERRVVGLGVLSIRPSVRDGAFIGVIDALALAPSAAAGDDDRRQAMAASMLEQLVGSARNKGCARVEVADPLASAEPPLWERAGFAPRGTFLSRPVG
jgi:predicted N-acetyltransferase YhbS